MNDMLLEGRLADLDGVRRGRVRVEQGEIVAVGDLSGRPDRVFDDDCLIFAGMGDIHIHAREDISRKEVHKETFATASAAALHGGVVHVADMPNNVFPPIDDATYAAKEALVRRGHLPVHFTLYAGVAPGTRPLQRQVPYKAYMAKSVGEIHFTDMDELDRTLARYRGAHVSFHCEDPVVLEQNKGAPTHEERRPPSAEVSATAVALALIEKHGLVGKLCHYSVAEGLPMIAEAKKRGVPVTAEVTPHHLYFDSSGINDGNRAMMQMNPPLRSAPDRQAMLAALKDGLVDYLATDHAPHTTMDKARGASGQPHLDTYGPFVTWLLVDQGFPPERIAAVCSANPGVFVNNFTSRRYGRIEPGYVGSLTVLNLAKPTTVRARELRTLCGWSPFDGHVFPGSVEAVVVDGVWMD